ncbi:MAG: ATP-binding protein [Syntrophobacteraceae bacterium]
MPREKGRNDTNFRVEAERKLKSGSSRPAEKPTEDVQRLIHELQVHQIELELQNEELRNAQIEPEIKVEETDIPEHPKSAIFRISQEAMNNAAKHSRAEWVDLVLVRHDQVIELSITDDGIGFDLDDVPDCARSYGLSAMKERTEQMDGRFTVESVPGKGTTVRAVWRLQ